MSLRGALPEGQAERVRADVERLLWAGLHVVLVVSQSDLAVVDAVARLRLVADRLGARLDVVGDRELLRLCGLDDAV